MSDTEYIITERKIFDWILQGKITKEEAAPVRSHPYHPAPELTDCPHHRSVFYDGNNKTKSMEHHCDFLTETCEIEGNKIRQSERENLLDELEKWGSGYYGYDVNIQTLKEKIGCLRRKEEKQ
jgi:hypothetical protein